MDSGLKRLIAIIRAMELVERELFLKYALPCGTNLVRWGRITQEELDKGMAMDINEYKVALFMCEQAAKKLGRTSIDREAIHQYFWRDHDETVLNHELVYKEIYPDQCIVYPGEYLGNGVVRLPIGERKVNICFTPNVKQGDYVTVHYSHTCEVIAPEDFNELAELKK